MFLRHREGRRGTRVHSRFRFALYAIIPADASGLDAWLTGGNEPWELVKRETSNFFVR